MDQNTQEQEYYESTPQQSQDRLLVLKETGLPNVQSVIQTIVKDVELGRIDPLDAFTVFKKMEAIFNEAKKQIDEYAIEEAERYGESTFTKNNQKYEIRNGSNRFNFKGIQEWEEKNKELKAIEDKYKQAYKNSVLNIGSYDKYTGEVIDLPTVTTSKKSLIVK